MKKGEAGMLKALERDFIDKEREKEEKEEKKSSCFVFRSRYMNVHEEKM